MHIVHSVLALLFGVSLQAQLFTLDDFEAGDFSVTGSSSFTQTLPEQNVLGGERRVTLSDTSIDTASVSSGLLRLVRNENSILTLNYGSFGDANESQHLHFDARSPDSTFDIEVPFVRREGVTVTARFYSFTLDGGTPTHEYSSASVSFYSSEPFEKSIPFGSFVGNANLHDIAGFQLQIGHLDGRREQIELSGATLTVIPEPTQSAMFTAAGLTAYTLFRRRRAAEI